MCFFLQKRLLRAQMDSTQLILFTPGEYSQKPEEERLVGCSAHQLLGIHSMRANCDGRKRWDGSTGSLCFLRSLNPHVTILLASLSSFLFYPFSSPLFYHSSSSSSSSLSSDSSSLQSSSGQHCMVLFPQNYLKPTQLVYVHFISEIAQKMAFASR